MEVLRARLPGANTGLGWASCLKIVILANAIFLSGALNAQQVTLETTVGFDQLENQDPGFAWEGAAGVRFADPPLQLQIGLGRKWQDASGGCLSVECTQNARADVGLNTVFLETRYWFHALVGSRADLFVGLRSGLADLEASDVDGWTVGASAGVHVSLPGGLILAGSVLRDQVELDTSGSEVATEIGEGLSRWGLRFGIGARF